MMIMRDVVRKSTRSRGSMNPGRDGAMMLSRYRLLLIPLLAITQYLGACGGSDEQASIGGVVTGLASGSSVTLQNVPADTLTLTDDGAFTFALTLPALAPFDVAVSHQPLGQTCTVADGSGQVVGNKNVTHVGVTCVTVASLTGTVTGLTVGTNLVLSNGAVLLPVTANGDFTFPGLLATGSTYSVTIATQPLGEHCTLVNGSGTVPLSRIVIVGAACS